MDLFKTIYSIEELEGRGVDSQDLKKGMSIKYRNKLFIRAANHPKSFRDIAYQECNQYLESGLDSFVVESRFYLTIWKEEKLETEPQRVESINYHFTNGSSTKTTPNLEQVITAQENSPEEVSVKLSLKVTPKKYRGQDY